MYKKGDIVKIRSDLKHGAVYSNCVLTTRMLDYIGKYATILGFYNKVSSTYYSLNIDNTKYSWSAEMFESVKPKLFKLL